MTQYPQTPAATRHPLSQWIRKGGGVAAFACATGLILVALILVWLAQTSESVYKEGADALVIRAVLRTDTDNVTAEMLAERVRDQVPDASIEVINEAMGRSLLALQEPWIAEMPDFDVTPLPTLLEISHPDLLTDPAGVAAFVERLGRQPEVDFVSYNETAHDRLVKLATSSGAIESHALRWLLMAIGLVAAISLLSCLLLSAPRSVAGIPIKSTMIWLPAWAVAWLLFRGWESTAIASGEWKRLTFGAHLAVGFIAGIIVSAAALASWSIRKAAR